MPPGVPDFNRKSAAGAFGDWTDRAECRPYDRELWFPPSDGPRRQLGDDAGFALAVCADCPVRADCLEHALEHHEQGIWGGTGTEQRRVMRRRQSRREQMARARAEQREGAA